MEALREGLVRIAEEAAPATVRHLFYRAVGAGLVPKTEAAYKGIVIRLLTDLRRAGRIPYSWITDGTRFINQVSTYLSAEDALEEWAGTYRRNLWDSAGVRVEVWCEKDAIAGILMPITHRWRVPLCVVRGYCSESFVWQIAQEIKAADVPTFVYHLGDHDPSGVDLERDMAARVRALAPEADITIERVAVTPEQIVQYGLPTRPTKPTDTRSRKFIGESVEVDAMDPRELQTLLENRITRHLDGDELERLIGIEAQERATLKSLAVGLREAS